jgi:DNA-binding transcriptional regulator YiaG
MNKSKTQTKRRANAGTIRDDVPYTMKLPDGQTVFVLVPAKWCERDVSGEIAFKPDAVRFLDKVRVMAMKVPKQPTPGFIRTLREALGLTQAGFGQRLGVDLMTVSRWERGTSRPGRLALKALEELKVAAARQGVTLAA